jgi:UDP-N-acetylglucosamine:LPS N-acetylglucosamine transferase
MSEEKDIVPEVFAATISNLLNDPSRRAAMAAAARKMTPESAAKNVADVMERAVREGIK